MLTRSELLKALKSAGIGFEIREAGGCWMVVAPSLGARILGAGVGEENAFWAAPVIRRASWNEGGNAGGQRTWIAPEAGPQGFFFTADGSRWNVPTDLDPGNYRQVSIPCDEWLSYRNSFTARAADGAAFPLLLTRRVSVNDSQETLLRIRLRQEVENAGNLPVAKRVGLWSIIQLPSIRPGTILIPLLRVPADSAASAFRPYFSAPPPDCTDIVGSTLLVKTLVGLKYKIGVRAENATGRIAYLRRSRPSGRHASRWVLVAMSYVIDPAGTYLDKPLPDRGTNLVNGDSVQAYNDAGLGDAAFCEIEAHAPALVLEPGESQSQELEIIIVTGEKV